MILFKAERETDIDIDNRRRFLNAHLEQRKDHYADLYLYLVAIFHSKWRRGSFTGRGHGI